MLHVQFAYLLLHLHVYKWKRAAYCVSLLKISIVSNDRFSNRTGVAHVLVLLIPSFTEYFHFSDDVIYLDDEAERQEYVMAEDGLIWRGSHNRLRPTVWKYAQFERDILDCALHLMNYVGKVRVSGRNDPVIITRCLSAAVSHNRGKEFSPQN